MGRALIHMSECSRCNAKFPYDPLNKPQLRLVNNRLTVVLWCEDCYAEYDRQEAEAQSCKDSDSKLLADFFASLQHE